MSDASKITLARSPCPIASIIIAVSEPIDRLLACLRSLSASIADATPYEIIVVLNDPEESEVGRLQALVEGVEIIVSSVNLGLAGGCNRGRAGARGDYPVLLHDDTEVEAGWLEALVALAERDHHIGAVGSKILNLDGSLQSAGMIIWRDGATSPTWLGDDAPPEREVTEVCAVDQCASCSLLVRASVWDRIGGLDERFYPAYYVDVDLCMSLRQSGFSVVFEPSSRLRHHRNASTDVLFRTFIFGLNRSMFIAKWSGVLAAHVARDDDALAGSKAAALTRSASEHSARASKNDPVGPGAAQVADDSFDADDQARRHLAMERSLLKGYVAVLAEHLDASRHGSGKPAPLYRMGTEIVFHDRGNAWDYLVEDGCHAPEGLGVWLLEQCRMVLPLELSLYEDGARALRLSFSVLHLLAKERPRSPFRLAINGVVLLDGAEEHAAREQYEVDIPTGLHDKLKVLIVQIDVHDRRAPKDLDGESDDTRLLGMGLVSMRVTSANPV